MGMGQATRRLSFGFLVLFLALARASEGASSQYSCYPGSPHCLDDDVTALLQSRAETARGADRLLTHDRATDQSLTFKESIDPFKNNEHSADHRRKGSLSKHKDHSDARRPSRDEHASHGVGHRQK